MYCARYESFGQAATGSSLLTSSSTASSILGKRPIMDRGRRSLVSADEDVMDHIFNVDPTIFEKSTYHVGTVDVGRLFLKYQVASTATVNDLRIKACPENLEKFL